MPPPAARPVLPQQVGTASGLALVALAALALAVVGDEQPWKVLVASVVAVAVVGPLVWVVGGSVGTPDRDALAQVDVPLDTAGARTGFTRGLAVGLAVGAVVVLVLVLLDQVLGDAGASTLTLATVAMVQAVAQASTARDLHRWQRRTGLVVCTRAGARRWAWTRRQAQDRLIAARPAPTG